MEAETQNPSPSIPPPSEEPAQKKIKLTTTTTTTTTTSVGDSKFDSSITSEITDAGTKKSNYKRRKIAIFFAYCGVGYQGMQKNPGAKTIEGDLEEALELSGAVPEQYSGYPKSWDWSRSARTDKGVSAICQVVSGWFLVDPPGFVDRLNSHLADQIRIFGYKRVTPTFNAKKYCDRRRYVYLLPVFALDPGCHQEAFRSFDEVANCLECSKVPVLMEKIECKVDQDPGLVVSESVVDSGISSNSEPAVCETDNDSSLEKKDLIESGKSDCHVKLQKSSGGELNGSEEEKGVKRREFSYGEKEKEKLNRILKYFEGTHNFHNFTTRTKAEDPSAQRYIVSFTAKTNLTIEGIEFVKCEVLGQSFMLHQIRKMIGMAVAIMRGCAEESIFDTAFQKDVRMNVPLAPEVGLFLDECVFTSYNNKWKKTHEELSMKSYSEEADEFRKKYIYSHIAKTEHKEGVVGLWLHYINHQNYPDLRPPPQSESLQDSKAAAAAPEVCIGDPEE